MNQTYSADWDCNSTYGVRLTYSSDTIGPVTTWANPPSDAGTGLTDQVGGTGSTGCMGTVPFSCDMTGVVQNGASPEQIRAVQATWTAAARRLKADLNAA
ncbi:MULTISPECIES: hypothetical protein [unclassified Streptomyces]|uniref:hypothetical protein n=1 Tax=unclassified Streptomyces TaxID=2593676 RepID=UPI0038298CC6